MVRGTVNPSAFAGRAVFDDEVLTLDVSELSEPLSERVEVRDIRARFQVLQHADTMSRPRLLCPGGERRGDKASRQCTYEASTIDPSLVGC